MSRFELHMKERWPRARPAVFVSRDVFADVGNLTLGRAYEALFIMVGQEPAVGRGERTLTDVERDVDEVRSSLRNVGVELDGVLYCPHDPSAQVKDLRGPCDCRAPAPGLFLRAAEEFGIDLAASWAFVGSPSERDAAAQAGVGRVSARLERLPVALPAMHPATSVSSPLNAGARFVNVRFGTNPAVVHANGRARLRQLWKEVRHLCFATAPAELRSVSAPEVTVLTWNTELSSGDYLALPRHPGMLEASLDRFSARYVVLGRGRGPMATTAEKLTYLLNALETVRTPLVAGIDSYDAVALAPPPEMARRFVHDFDCALLFGAEYPCWPRPFGHFARIAAFQRANARGGVPYLQGGMWIGELETCREFFQAAAAAPMQTAAEVSMPADLAAWEQPRYVWTLPDFHPRVQIDHGCRIFQSLTCPSADVTTLQLS